MLSDQMSLNEFANPTDYTFSEDTTILICYTAILHTDGVFFARQYLYPPSLQRKEKDIKKRSLSSFSTLLLKQNNRDEHNVIASRTATAPVIKTLNSLTTL